MHILNQQKGVTKTEKKGSHFQKQEQQFFVCICVTWVLVCARILRPHLFKHTDGRRKQAWRRLLNIISQALNQTGPDLDQWIPSADCKRNSALLISRLWLPPFKSLRRLSTSFYLHSFCKELYELLSGWSFRGTKMAVLVWPLKDSLSSIMI